MTVYSGFATKQQQQKYNFLLQTLIVALKKRLLKFYKQQQCDESKFKLLIKKIYKKMFLLQKGKYITPKYTTCFMDLIQQLSIEINFDTMSDVSSMMSQTFSFRKQNTRKDSQTLDQDDDNLRSRNILQSKRNLLQLHRNSHTTTLNASNFSLKKPLFNTVNMDNQEDSRTSVQNQFVRSSSLGQEQPLNALKGKVKLRRIQDLKNLRGTINMPKVEDFLPKKQQISPNQHIFKRPSIIDASKQFRGGYRRQKYSRADVNIQQI